MLYGKIDVELVIGGRFASLQPATKATLHVISAIASFKTGHFFHSCTTIAKLAGISTRSAQRALVELLEHKIISIVLQRPGETTVYRYNFVASGDDRGGYSTYDTRPIPDASEPTLFLKEVPVFAQPHFEPTTPMSAPSDTHVVGPTTPMSYKQTLLNEVINNNTTSADRISKSLIAKMRTEYGDRVVDVVIASMRNMNGEVKDPDAYFASAVRNGYIPTSKKAKQRQEAAARNKAQNRQLAEIRAERERWERELEQSDPDIAAHEIEKIQKLLGDDQDNLSRTNAS